jgi:hypothetical protein
VCGQLSDIGWPLGGGCLQYFQDIADLQFAEAPDPSTASVTLSWRERSDASIQRYMIERKYFDGEFEEVDANITRDGNAFEATVDSLGVGRFAFRVAWINGDGSKGVSAQQLDTSIPVQNLAASVSKDDQGRGTVEFTWGVPPGTPETIEYRVERAPGIGSDFRDVGTTSQRQFTADRQTPGEYQYRVVSTDTQGNELASESKSIEISFEGDVFIAGPFPNPARDRATVEVTAQDGQNVAVEVFNTLGERVYFEERTLKLRRPTRLTFDSRQWGSGLYFLRLRGEQFTRTRKIMIVH